MEEYIHIKTKRLLIRTYQMEDQEAVYPVINDPYISDTTLNIPYPYPKDQLAVWIHFTQKNSMYKNGYECGIFLDEKYIGNIGLVNIDKINNSAEISYFIGKNYKNQGYASEAVKAVCEFGFNETGLERIVGRCMFHNKASKRVLEKSGFLFEGIARHEVIKAGKYIDVYHFARLYDDILDE